MQLRSRRIAEIAIFSASAVVVYVFETFIPRPFPWMRFGFANIIILISLYLLGFRISLLVVVMKSVLGGMLVGNLFTPTFIFSISGGIISLITMALILAAVPRFFSPLGISIWGALAHNLTQLIVASLIFIGRFEILYLFPFFIILSVITGSITGIISLIVLRRIPKKIKANIKVKI